MNDKHDGCKNKANTTSKLNTDQEGREESQTPSQEGKEAYPRQEIRDSPEMWKSYCKTERYWHIPETEEIKLDILATTKFRDKDEGEIQKASNIDDEIQDIKTNVHKGRKEMKEIPLGQSQWQDGLLWYQAKIWITKEKGILITLIAKYHEPAQAGHGGTAKSTGLISRRYYWPKIREDIKRFMKNCDTCQRTKVVRHAPHGLLQSNEAPD